ncbi:hypothetical protein K7432_011390 [Basidiobolus ranarum]|uniref:Uncharacterized protein n=1 Tax=Basidiobolus ranarum TaxID=34480 RepID=A0ABR2WMD1_9FUNG
MFNILKSYAYKSKILERALEITASLQQVSVNSITRNTPSSVWYTKTQPILIPNPILNRRPPIRYSKNLSPRHYSTHASTVSTVPPTHDAIRFSVRNSELFNKFCATKPKNDIYRKSQLINMAPTIKYKPRYIPPRSIVRSRRHQFN